MDKKLAKYVNHEVNVYIGPAKFVRDITPSGMEHIRVYTVPDPGGTELEMYQYWNNPNRKKNSDTPKHTGGKKPYVMVMTTETEKMCETLPGSEEMIGFMVRLGKYMEWNTGRLIDKKKKPLKYEDLLKIFKCSKPKLNKMISLLKEFEILTHTSKGYYISFNYVKKGKANKKEDTRDVL